MGGKKTPTHRCTVGSLLLQAAVLIGIAALFYLESIEETYELTAGLGSMAAAVFGGLGATAIWLAGEHYSENMKSSRLQLWAISFIFLSLFPLVSFTGMFILYHSIISLVYLLPVLLFFIASILVLYFSRKDNSTEVDLSNQGE